MLRKRLGSAGEDLLCVGDVVVLVLGEGVWLRVLLENLNALVCLMSGPLRGEGVWLRVLLENLNALVCLMSGPLRVLLRFIVRAHGWRHVVMV